MVLKDSQLPELKQWKVGNTYHLMIEVEQLSLDAPDPNEGSKQWTGRFSVKSVKPISGGGDTMDGKSAKTEALRRKSTSY